MYYSLYVIRKYAKTRKKRAPKIKIIPEFPFFHNNVKSHYSSSTSPVDINSEEKMSTHTRKHTQHVHKRAQVRARGLDRDEHGQLVSDL